MTETAPEMVQLEIRKSPDAELVVGGLRIVACRREVGEFDGGISVYLWDGRTDVGGEPVELVRLDLFRKRPHYHAPAETQAETAIDAGERGAAAWGVETLTTRAQSLVMEAGFDEIAAALDMGALATAGSAIQSFFDGLEQPTEIASFAVPVSIIESLRS